MTFRFVVDANVRKVAKGKGKKVSKSYLAWLNRKVHMTILDSIHALGSRVTLNVEDAEAYESAKKLTSRRKRI